MDVFDKLKSQMYGNCSILDPENNPVSKNMQFQSTRSLVYVIEQYSTFPRLIVEMLRTAQHTLAPWATVADALDDNIQEELGSRTGGISHYNLLREGVLDEFGLDIQPVTPVGSTSAFHNECHGFLRSASLATAAGAIYAIEATSIGEIKCVAAIANEVSTRVNGRPLPIDGKVNRFLMEHIEDFEVGHERELRTALRPLLTTENQAEFNEGVQDVIDAMSRWWSGLESEAISNQMNTANI